MRLDSAWDLWRLWLVCSILWAAGWSVVFYQNYAATYRAVQEAIAAQLPSRAPDRVAAHALLRQHGQTLCKTSRPACPACPLAGGCAYRAGTL